MDEYHDHMKTVRDYLEHRLKVSLYFLLLLKLSFSLHNCRKRLARMFVSMVAMVTPASDFQTPVISLWLPRHSQVLGLPLV